ncbi:MAG: hypothetical protein ABIJ05_00120 [Patescibacteria group bacterium]
MVERSLCIHVDGMDLSGKTETSLLLAKNKGGDWEIRRSTLLENNPIYRFTNNLYKNNEATTETLGFLYLAALLHDIENFEWPKKNIIQDSTIILRSIAYYTVNQNPRILEAFENLIPKHPKFSASFILDANMEERLKRLEKRLNTNEKISSGDLMIKTDPTKFIALNNCLIDSARRIFNSKIIDTSNTNVSSVVQLLDDEIVTKKCSYNNN